jgi:preprotein translocase subunit SecA
MIYDTVYTILEKHIDSQNLQELEADIIMTFSNENLVNNINLQKIEDSIDQLASEMTLEVENNYKQKLLRIKDEAFPVIQRIYDSKDNNYKNILIPFSDGINSINIICNLEDAINDSGASIITSFEKGIILSSIDKAWKEHLKSMDELKQSVQGAVYEQKDPLLIYKFESFNLFSTLLEDVNKDVLSFLFKANLPQRDPKELKNTPIQRKIEGKASRGQEERLDSSKRLSQSQNNQPQLSRRQRRAQERKIRRG